MEEEINYTPKRILVIPKEEKTVSSIRLRQSMLNRILSRMEDYGVENVCEFIYKATSKFLKNRDKSETIDISHLDVPSEHPDPKELVPIYLEPSKIEELKKIGDNKLTAGIEMAIEWWMDDDDKVREKYPNWRLSPPADEARLLDLELAAKKLEAKYMVGY